MTASASITVGRRRIVVERKALPVRFVPSSKPAAIISSTTNVGAKINTPFRPLADEISALLRTRPIRFPDELVGGVV